MPAVSTPTCDVTQWLTSVCARNIPALLHYETPEGTVITTRIRLLEVAQGRVLADQPLYIDHDGRIPRGPKITVHISMDGKRYQFASKIESLSVSVRLNQYQRIPGIALRMPSMIAASQRRAHLRISVASYDPIRVRLVRPHPELPDACAIDEPVIPAVMINLSVGGMSLLIDSRVLPTAQRGERFYAGFRLPEADEELHLLISSRHTRFVRSSESLRLGFAFLPWRGKQFTRDQRVIARFVAGDQRRSLRRRKERAWNRT